MNRRPEKEPPYPADTKSKGWRFEVNMEVIKASDTWLRARTGRARGALLLLWSESWMQTPCGSLPDDDELISLMIDMSEEDFRHDRRILMRGWWLATDGRWYHDTITERVLDMLEKRRGDAGRQAENRRRKAAASSAMSHDSVTGGVTGGVTPGVTDESHGVTRDNANVTRDKVDVTRESDGVTRESSTRTRTSTSPSVAAATGDESPLVFSEKIGSAADQFPTRFPDDEPPPHPLPDHPDDGYGGPPPRDDEPEIPIAKRVWDEGVALLTGRAQMSDKDARKMIGKLVRDAHDDGELLRIIQETWASQSLDPVPLLRAGVEFVAGRRADRNGNRAVGKLPPRAAYSSHTKFSDRDVPF